VWRGGEELRKSPSARQRWETSGRKPCEFVKKLRSQVYGRGEGGGACSRQRHNQKGKRVILHLQDVSSVKKSKSLGGRTCDVGAKKLTPKIQISVIRMKSRGKLITGISSVGWVKKADGQHSECTCRESKKAFLIITCEQNGT